MQPRQFITRPSTSPAAVVLCLTGCLLMAGVLPVPGAAQQQRSAEDSARVMHLLERATFGVRAHDVETVLAAGTAVWLERQLWPDRIRDTAVSALVARYPALTMTPAALASEYTPGGSGRSPQMLLQELAAAKLERSARTDRQLEEVMTDFWFNHFNVFFQKGADRYLVSDYERTAIRPHVFGSFEDMLRATARHPAMLFYLDNWQSVHVDPTVQRAAARRNPAQQQQRMQRGLNENYARELLELHTLGVEGGYTQADVIAVARALTGWTFEPLRPGSPDPGTFAFRPMLHDRDEKTVLGRTLPAGRGIEDGEDVLRMLAAHPSTAKYIASRLVMYFVTDAGSPALEAKLADAFTRSHGDLRLVTRTLFTDSLFYATAYRRTKVKTPLQLVVGALRATDAEIVNARGVLQVLRTMGQLPYMASAPTGYPSASGDWVNSAAMLARMNFGIDLATGRIAGVKLRNAKAPFTPSPALAAAIRSDLAAQTGLDARARAARELGLLIGSPEFQKR